MGSEVTDVFHTARLERGAHIPLRFVLGRNDTLGLIM